MPNLTELRETMDGINAQPLTHSQIHWERCFGGLTLARHGYVVDTMGHAYKNGVAVGDVWELCAEIFDISDKAELARLLHSANPVRYLNYAVEEYEAGRVPKSGWIWTHRRDLVEIS